MIKSYVGPMFSGKSDSLIKDYKSIWNKDLIIAFKPRKDTRDGAFIKSKNYNEKIPAVLIDNLSEIIDYVKDGHYRTVLIDEAELLEGDVTILADLSVIFEIDFKIAGLNMTSEQEPFGIMGDILAVSDEVEIIKDHAKIVQDQVFIRFIWAMIKKVKLKLEILTMFLCVLDV